jgi:hypothetical protein
MEAWEPSAMNTDTFGISLASTWLTSADQAGPVFFPCAPANQPLPLRSNQLMIQADDPMILTLGVFVQTDLAEIPNPGRNAAIPNAFTRTFRIIALS